MSDVKTRTSSVAKRIAIAIELDHAYPWHHDCLQGILQYAQQHDWQCVVDPFLAEFSGQDNETGYDGVVGRIGEQVAQIAKAQGIPAVNHWGDSPAGEVPAVLMDSIACGVLSGEHLIACGYRRFAYAGIETNRPAEKELQGFRQVLDEKGFRAPDVWRYADDYEKQRGSLIRFRRGLHEWLSGLERPVGIVTDNSTAGRYLAQSCSEMGLKVPDDVGLVVQTSDYSTETGVPSISSIQCDFFRVGLEAAQLLDQLMQGKSVHPLKRNVKPDRLIARDSTDVFLCDDPLVKEAMRYIAKHCRRTLRIEDVTDALHTSESTLRRRFEKAIGRQIKDEIARQRCDQVKTVLVETEKQLATISSEFGFSSPTQFARYFTNAVGTTPSEYRKQNQADSGR